MMRFLRQYYSSSLKSIEFLAPQVCACSHRCRQHLHSSSGGGDNNNNYNKNSSSALSDKPVRATTTTVQSTIPIFDASPLLDPHVFCKRGGLLSPPHKNRAFSKSGGDAARRLSRGREVATRRLQALAADNKQKRPNKPFVLAGHGVPKELLQHLINVAHEILNRIGYYRKHFPGRNDAIIDGDGDEEEDYTAAACSFSNLSGLLSLNGMRIRGNNGKLQASSWPVRTDDMRRPEQEMWKELEHGLDLYLAVMNRIAVTFGSFVVETRKKTRNSSSDGGGNNGFEEDFIASSLIQIRPKHWNAEFQRGLVYASHSIPVEEGTTVSPPIAELTFSRTSSDSRSAPPGHVRITLQGMPSSVERTVAPLSVTFDASFDCMVQ